MNTDTLLELYSEMVRLRVVEESIAEHYPEQEMRCPVHLSIGQEAVAVGTCFHLESSDQILSTHRSHGHYLAKGGDLRAMMAEIYGKAAGCSQGYGGSMHLVDLDVGFLGAAPIVGSTIPIAVGSALTAKITASGQVTVVFFGDGSTEEGVFSESLNFAALKSLPVVFVCENNLYSVYSPLSVRQPEARDNSRIAEAHGVPATSGDGNDIVEVHDLTREAIRRARQGDGPGFVEFATYRWREHCGPFYDNQLGYRTEQEFLTWQARDPVAAAEKALVGSGAIDAARVEQIKRQHRDDAEEAIAHARGCPLPTFESDEWRVYAP